MVAGLVRHFIPSWSELLALWVLAYLLRSEPLLVEIFIRNYLHLDCCREYQE